MKYCSTQLTLRLGRGIGVAVEVELKCGHGSGALRCIFVVACDYRVSWVKMCDADCCCLEVVRHGNQ